MAMPAKEISRAWRRRNRPTTALLNKRMGFVRAQCMTYVRKYMPELYQRYKRDAQRMFPAFMLTDWED